MLVELFRSGMNNSTSSGRSEADDARLVELFMQHMNNSPRPLRRRRFGEAAETGAVDRGGWFVLTTIGCVDAAGVAPVSASLSTAISISPATAIGTPQRRTRWLPTGGHRFSSGAVSRSRARSASITADTSWRPQCQTSIADVLDGRSRRVVARYLQGLSKRDRGRLSVRRERQRQARTRSPTCSS